VGASQLLGLDIVLSVLAAGAWCAAAWSMVDAGRHSPGGMGGRRSTGLLLPLLVGAALVLTAAKVAVVAALTAAGWLFASERAAVGLPLLVLPATLAGLAGFAHLRRRLPDAAAPRPVAPVLAVWAAIGAVFSMIAPFVLGFDPHPAGIGTFLALAACCALAAWILAGNSASANSRRTTAASAVGAPASVGWAAGARTEPPLPPSVITGARWLRNLPERAVSVQSRNSPEIRPLEPGSVTLS
jgi:hypothetical protein